MGIKSSNNSVLKMKQNSFKNRYCWYVWSEGFY